jgi:hypothetical protein
MQNVHKHQNEEELHTTVNVNCAKSIVNADVLMKMLVFLVILLFQIYQCASFCQMYFIRSLPLQPYRSVIFMAEGQTPLVANGRRVEAIPGTSLMEVVTMLLSQYLKILFHVASIYL